MKTLTINTQSISFGGNGAAFLKGLKNNAMIRRGNKLVLIDLSQENFAAYRDNGVFEGIEEVHLVLTHTHGDHASGLGDMGLYSFFSIQPAFSKKFFVYSPAAIAEDVKALLRIMGCTAQHFDFVTIEEAVTIAGVTFSPVEVDHVAELICFGYIVEMDGKRIYYSGDANMIPAAVLNELVDGKFDEFYQDTCVAEYPGNVHLSLSLLTELIPAAVRSKVHCMHLDAGFPVKEAIDRGFNVVDTSL